MNSSDWLVSDALLDIAAPSTRNDDGFRDWWKRSIRRSMSRGLAELVTAVRDQSDIRAVLPTITSPTLVLYRRDNSFLTVEHTRYIAEQVPNARFVELDGADQFMFTTEQGPLLEEIQEFLTGSRPEPAVDRVLATVLFEDLVGSTEALASTGDERWVEVLETHDDAVRRQLARFRGVEVKTTGDGFLATFDGPARAVHCALAILDSLQRLALRARIGVHTGEIERRGDDVAGIAVHIGQRVSSLASDGEVLVSRTVTDLVAGSGLEFEDRGEHELKGVPGTWQLFSVKS
jgi:class 3 adenylate cyclase